MKQFETSVILAALLTLLVSACSQAPVALTPQRRTLQNDAALYATATSGGLYVGSVTSGDTDTALLEKFSRGGRQGWVKRIAPRPGDDYAELTEVEHDPAGNVYALYTSVKTIFGEEGDERLETRFVRRYGPTGAVAWTRDVTALNPQAFGYDALGNLYFVVRPGTAFELIKVAPNGAQLLRRVLGVANVWGFKVLPDGSSRVLDRSSLDTGRVFGFDAQGQRLWDAPFTGQAVELAVAPDGSSFVVGYGASADPFGNTSVQLAKYTAAGAPAWTRAASGGGYRDLGGLAPDGRGGVLVGVSGKDRLGSSDDTDVFVSRFSASGGRVWMKTFASAADDYLYDIAALGASEYYLVGSTRGSLGGRNRGGSDTFVIRLDGSGNRVWAR